MVFRWDTVLFRRNVILICSFSGYCRNAIATF
nr:MAG TPA: hypothetical protein [Bacteriophage sp.]